MIRYIPAVGVVSVDISFTWLPVTILSDVFPG